jgi:hypothetical protein
MKTYLFLVALIAFLSAAAEAQYIKIIDGAYASSPITSVDAGRKDKTFKAGEPIYAYLKFDSKLKGRFVSDEVFLTLSIRGANERYTGYDREIYRLSDAEKEKSELTIQILPTELDLDNPWMRDAYYKFTGFAKSKQKVLVKFRIQYYPTEPRTGEITGSDDLFIDFSEGFGYKVAGIKRQQLEASPEAAKITIGKLQADKKLVADILEQTKKAIEGSVLYEGFVIEKIVIPDDDWEYRRNDLGVILSRDIVYRYLARNAKTGECIYGFNNAFQENTGGTQYGVVRVNDLKNGNPREYGVPKEIYDGWISQASSKGAASGNASSKKGKK